MTLKRASTTRQLFKDAPTCQHSCIYTLGWPLSLFVSVRQLGSDGEAVVCAAVPPPGRSGRTPQRPGHVPPGGRAHPDVAGTSLPHAHRHRRGNRPQRHLVSDTSVSLPNSPSLIRLSTLGFLSLKTVSEFFTMYVQ